MFDKMSSAYSGNDQMRTAGLLFLVLSAALAAENPLLEKEDIFPLDVLHNHASSIVRLPDGELFVCWYRGSGERDADDVRIMAARKKPGSTWSVPFVLADVPGFPDTNPTLFLDSKSRLWFYWQTIVANRWETAVTQVRIAADYRGAGGPVWESSQPLFLKPKDIAERVEAWGTSNPAVASNPRFPQLLEHARDKYFSRMGWMGRAHPFELPSGRILLPLYSDGYSFGLVAVTDDGGRTFHASQPIVGAGCIQPTIARRKDGTLVAFLRDNGPPPKRVLRSESTDDGESWSFAVDTDIPNSGTGLEVLMLKDGRWLMINNDTEQGRYSLAVTLSDDEGRTWKWKRHLELDTRAERPTSFHYPSILQAPDGSLHASYSVSLNDRPSGQPRQTIRHAHFNLAWVEQGEGLAFDAGKPGAPPAEMASSFRRGPTQSVPILPVR
jgi:predicted neuraminidase